MIYHRISDFDDAYANGPNVPRGDRWPDAWVAPSAAYRDELASGGRAKLGLAYGERARNRLDLFLPAGEPKGLVIFVHGGYWLRFDNSYWSHLARGAGENGYAVAMPSYTLCPEIRIAGIVAEVGAAIEHAAEMIAGPIHLTGHSAGGHLASRMICADSPLGEPVRRRIGNTISLSGVHDLRPLMRTGTARADGQCAHHLLGRRRRALGVHPPECPARQCLDGARRGNRDGGRAGPPPLHRH